MIKLQDAELISVLPAYVKDDTDVQAISYAYKMGMSKMLEFARKALLYANLEELPDEILDLLALELRTQYYDQDMDIDTKRALVKNTIIWYTKAGTREAVEELVATIFGAGEVAEWFEYGDEPYYFKITTDATLTDDITEQLLDMIDSVKNSRSHLRKVDVQKGAGDITVYLAAILQEQSYITLGSNIEKDEEIYINPKALVAATGEIYEDCEGNFGRTLSAAADTELLSAATGIGYTSVTMLLGHGTSSEMQAEQVSAATAIGSAVSAHLQ